VETGEGLAVARVEVMGEAKVVVEMEEEVTEVVEMEGVAEVVVKGEGKEEETGVDLGVMEMEVEVTAEES